MKNEFLDKVEDNTVVRIWSEKMQLEKGDSLAEGCFTFGRVDLVPIVEEYTSLLHYPKVQVDQTYSKAANTLPSVKKLMNISGMSEQWVTARIQQKGDGKYTSWASLRDLIVAHPDMKKKVDVFALSIYGLVIFPKTLMHIDEAVVDLFERLNKRVTPVPTILAETHFSKVNKMPFRVFSENYSSLKEITATPRRDDISEENWIVLLRNIQEEDIEWRAHWLVPDKILYLYGSFDWTRQMKRLVIGSMMTSEYKEWLHKKINDNVPEPSLGGV
ncbi:hypothetical protein CXB51_006864 [Gossypium anomalum]|uniref:DUF7745 domain-containing protein n=1 Tax=Gossypium anomalum TaxID=47600 RepID=A0A8J5ZEG3_9ROSI|nr:hypothetical protein CXB51_006864 [Gossypium anomalum]